MISNKEIILVNVSKKSERIEFIDVFRGIGILLMIAGHINFGEKFDYFIHAFHMPMFFFISGYFYKNKDIDFKSFIFKKIKSLLIPYISFGVFHYIVWLIFFREGNILRPLKHLLLDNTNDMPIAGALWFLTSLFLVDVIYYFLRKYVKISYVLNIIIFLIALFGCSYNLIFSFTLPWALDAACVGIGLYHSAYLLKIHKEKFIVKKLFNMNLILWILSSIVCIILIFVNGYINMRTGDYGIIPLFWINALLSIFIIWNLSRFINDKLGNMKIIVLIKTIGKNSVTYLCLNQIVILFFAKIFKLISLPLSQVIILILSLLTLSVCDAIIRKTKLCFIIGK